MLVHVLASSLNPLDYKLADLNFVGRTPPVVLGFDVAGIVVGRGDSVKRFAVGDAAFGMIATNQDGAWAVRRRGRLCAGAAGQGHQGRSDYSDPRRPACADFLRQRHRLPSL